MMQTNSSWLEGFDERLPGQLWLSCTSAAVFCLASTTLLVFHWMSLLLRFTFFSQDLLPDGTVSHY